MKKRFIFDLDGTLLHGNFKIEQDYFKSVLSKEDADKFLPLLFPMLEEYEKRFIKYEVPRLSKFLSNQLDINITDEIIEGWIDVNCNMGDVILPETIEMLEYLKSKGKSLVVLTNWFYKTQKSRLENMNILSYFDEVYAGDTYLKPSPESYLNAKGEYSINECVVIGDTIEKDVLGPKMIGMDSIYYNPSSKPYNKKLIYSIDSFEKIKEMY